MALATTSVERADNPLGAPVSATGVPGSPSTSSPRRASLQLNEIPASSAIGRQLATHPLYTLGAVFLCMVGFVFMGQVSEPLQFDASVDGFTPRGTPIATRINAGILIQTGFEEKTLLGYPLADCAKPPVEMWLAVCGGSAASGELSLTGIGDLVASLSTSCNPICMQAVAPWSRECRERQGMGSAALTQVIASVVVGKVKATVGNGPPLSAYTLSLTAAGCASSSYATTASYAALTGGDVATPATGATAECLAGLVGNCETAFEAQLDYNAAQIQEASHPTSNAGDNATQTLSPFCLSRLPEGVSPLRIDAFYAANEPANSGVSDGTSV